MNSIWYSILLSAICYSFAFLWPSYCAWAIFLFLPLLIPVFFAQKPFIYGLVWGLIAYGIHFFWFFDLLHTHSEASVIGALLGYLLAICYFSLTSGLWFWSTHKLLLFIKRVISEIMPQKLFWRVLSCIITIVMIIITTISYFMIIDRWILTPCGRIEGYPLVNPLIPLAHYSWFIKLCALVCSLYHNSGGVQQHGMSLNQSVSLVYLEPLVNKKKGRDKPWASNPYGVGQAIFHQLVLLDLEKYQDKPVIIVAPESAYRFALNYYPDVIDLWSTVLPKNAHLLIGSQRGEQGNLLQAVHWIHQRRIINFYVKKHRLPFVEKIPKIWRSFQWLSDLFLKDVVEFTAGKNKRQNKIFCLTPDMYAVPTMCSEFFFARPIEEFLNFKSRTRKSTAIFFFVNDSWFCDYFNTTLELFTRLKSAAIGLPVVYITHAKVDIISP